MNKRNKVRMLVPQYMKEFKCIGPECEDTCCAGWRVTIDKNTYKKYKNCMHPELKKELQENLKRNRQNASDYNYASIKMNNNASCPFLREDKLCKIQATLGESYLSITCNSYPRIYNFINGTFEKSASVSCPEVVRLALLNDKPMEFEYIEEEVNLRDIAAKSINNSDEELFAGAKELFWDLRSFTIDVLQDRSYRLWERLVILGIFYQTIQECIEQKNIGEIPVFIDEYQVGISNRIFDHTLEEVPSNELVQVGLLNNILKNREEKLINSSRFAECFTEFVKAIKPDDTASGSHIIENYLVAHKKYYQPFMSEHEYILENYLVNYVFKNIFPFGNSKNLFDNYIIMIVHYALIKMFLIGMAGYHKENFGVEHVAKLIQSFAKTIEHNNKFIDDAISFLRQNGYSTLSHMLLLIRN